MIHENEHLYIKYTNNSGKYTAAFVHVIFICMYSRLQPFAHGCWSWRYEVKEKECAKLQKVNINNNNHHYNGKSNNNMQLRLKSYKYIY